MISITRPEQNTGEHKILDDLIYNTPYMKHVTEMDRYVALNHLEMETQVCVNFNTECSMAIDLYQQQIDLPEDLCIIE